MKHPLLVMRIQQNIHSFKRKHSKTYTSKNLSFTKCPLLKISTVFLIYCNLSVIYNNFTDLLTDNFKNNSTCQYVAFLRRTLGRRGICSLSYLLNNEVVFACSPSPSLKLTEN